MRSLGSATIAVVAVVLGLLVAPGSAGASTVFSVHMSPSGSDGNDGLTSASPVATLAGAEAVLESAAPDTDAQVLIEPGVYVAGPTSWTFHIPGHSVSFRPTAGRPVFRSDGTVGNWFAFGVTGSDPGGDTNLSFIGLQVEGYVSGGIVLNGGSVRDADGLQVPSTAGANHNVIRNMVFRDIGSKYLSLPGRYGYGVIDTSNSSNNLITGNVFLDNENVSPYGGSIHSLYLANYSQDNVIVGNQFAYVSGDPIRVRNASGGAEIYWNVFVKAGAAAYVQDYFCGDACVAANASHARECPSHGVQVHDNIGIGGYADSSVPWTILTPEGNDETGGPLCPAGGPRMTSWDNVTLSLA
jgi:hypothetical protein